MNSAAAAHAVPVGRKRHRRLHAAVGQRQQLLAGACRRELVRSTPPPHASCGAVDAGQEFVQGSQSKDFHDFAPVVKVPSGTDLRTRRGEHFSGRRIGRKLEDSTNRENRSGPFYGSCCDADHSHGQSRATVWRSSQPGAGPRYGNFYATGSSLQTYGDLNRPVCHLASCVRPALSWAGAICRNHGRLGPG